MTALDQAFIRAFSQQGTLPVVPPPVPAVWPPLPAPPPWPPVAPPVPVVPPPPPPELPPGPEQECVFAHSASVAGWLVSTQAPMSDRLAKQETRISLGMNATAPAGREVSSARDQKQFCTSLGRDAQGFLGAHTWGGCQEESGSGGQCEVVPLLARKAILQAIR